ncbi:hypothetical protein [Petroclostridium sp. X23]|uniref:hypothetical protein n=1 Tax=Petroclostridium sp. X23 TaxID=3045146 RepID=UPI0024AC88A3|nr:hypothetical protein [Petroclostridium sp. X23]WHH57287.1 hypothetical protein QKW49_15780 [Petroclostridium sp. X23]
MLIPMIDTLCAVIDIVDYEKSTYELLKLLEQKKEEAKLVAASSASEKEIIKIGNLNFEILPNGSRRYAFILHNDGYEVKLAQFRATKECFYPVFIKIKSEYLWSNGPENSWKIIIDWVNNHVGKVKANKISRLDPCCHTDEFKLNIEDLYSFKGHFQQDSIHRDNREINAITFGSRSGRNIYSRIYNKVLEVNTKNQKLWFYDVWSQKGLDIDNVWNIEFEIKRDFFRNREIETVEDVFQRIRDIWQHCTGEWLVKVNYNRSRIERCEVDENWRKVQQAFNQYNGTGLISRVKQIEADASILIPGAIGYITSFAARNGITNIDDVFNTVYQQGVQYLSHKQQDFQSAITKKMSLLHKECEV